MEKEFVNYNQALKLKELGFDEPCAACYYKKFDNEIGYHKVYRDFNFVQLTVSAPTYSQAFRWFREKYGLLHDITLTTNVDDKLVGFYMLIHKMNDDLVVDEEDDDVEVEVMTTDKDEAELACLDKLIELVIKSE